MNVIFNSCWQALDLASLVQEKETNRNESHSYWECAANRCLVISFL